MFFIHQYLKNWMWFVFFFTQTHDLTAHQSFQAVFFYNYKSCFFILVCFAVCKLT